MLACVSASSLRISEAVYHSGRTPSGPGGALLYAFGYLDLAEVLECTLADAVGLVTDLELDPLDLTALARRRSGAPLEPTPRPFVRETRLVVPSHLLEQCGPPYGLADCWAFGYADLAMFGDCTVNAVRIAATNSCFDPRSLADVLAYLEGRRGRLNPRPAA